MKINNKEIEIAQDTLAILKLGFFRTIDGKCLDIKNLQYFAENNTKVYRPQDSDLLIKNRLKNVSKYNTSINVINDTTLNAARALINDGYTDCLCLNFASAKNIGGGFLSGSIAQEESLVRATGLYNCLLKANEYYQENRKTHSGFYTDYMIYSPNVPIFKDEKGNNLNELISVSFITAPAVNAGVVLKNERERLSEIEIVMKRRIEKILAIALNNNHLTLVLGAWGCGVFQNNPELIAKYFKDILETKFKNEFRKIVFAVFSSNNRFIAPFYKEFL